MKLNKDLKNRLREIWRIVSKLMSEEEPHGRMHVLRVFKLCIFILEKEGGDPYIVLPAALMHDLARYTQRH